MARILGARVCRGHLASIHAVLRPDRGRDRRATFHPPRLSFWAPCKGQNFPVYNAIRAGACGDKIPNYNGPRPGQECDLGYSSGNSCPRNAVSIFPLPGPEMKIACGRSTLSEDLGCSSPAPATKPRQYPNSICADPFSIINRNAKIFECNSESEIVDFKMFQFEFMDLITL